MSDVTRILLVEDLPADAELNEREVRKVQPLAVFLRVESLAEVAERDDVGLVAKKILENLTRPYQVSGREIRVTASIGISLYPRDGVDGETLLRNADVAMYRAKEDGATFRFYAPKMDQRIHETLELEADLRRALERGELLLHFQPKVDLATGSSARPVWPNWYTAYCGRAESPPACWNLS